MLPVKKWSEKPILKDAGTRPNHSKMDTGSVVYAMDQCHLGCFYGWSVFFTARASGSVEVMHQFHHHHHVENLVFGRFRPNSLFLGEKSFSRKFSAFFGETYNFCSFLKKGEKLVTCLRPVSYKHPV